MKLSVRKNWQFFYYSQGRREKHTLWHLRYVTKNQGRLCKEKLYSVDWLPSDKDLMVFI